MTQAVTVIGSNGFFVEIGPLLIAGAAAFAAGLAARTANKRQAQQLAHDREQQRRQLDHDRQRQLEALSHDREVRDLEHLRQLVDAAFESVLELSGAVADLEIALEDEGRNVALQTIKDASGSSMAEDEARELVSRSRSDIIKRQIRALERLAEAQTFGVRLTLRLGEHEIVQAHNVYVDAAKVRIDLNERLAQENCPLSNGDRREIVMKMEATSEALVQLTSAIEKWVGVSLSHQRADS
jgi:hypothetical protein